jgi:CBS domain-containing protein
MLSYGSEVLDRVRIGDWMSPTIVSCDPEAPITEVASLMSERHVHAIVVLADGRRPSAIVSDIDVMAAVACEGDGFAARDIAATAALTASSSDSLRDAAQRMAEHGVSHLIVLDQTNGQPVGVISSTDILAAYAIAAGSRRTS